MPETPDTIDDALDALVDPTTDEVLESTLTRDFSAREIAAAAVTRGGGAQTLQQVLTAGNDAGGLNISNVGVLTALDVVATDDVQVAGTFSAANGNVAIQPSGDCAFATDGNAFDVQTDEGTVSFEADLFTFDAAGTAGLFRVTSQSLVFAGPNAAPDDGQLLPGWFALWFDSTNGAAKLMIKAKQANGTVVTGQISLT